MELRVHELAGSLESDAEDRADVADRNALFGQVVGERFGFSKGVGSRREALGGRGRCQRRLYGHGNAPRWGIRLVAVHETSGYRSAPTPLCEETRSLGGLVETVRK